MRKAPLRAPQRQKADEVSTRWRELGFKLETDHPVIEPVSAMRRERKFPPQRQAGKSRLITQQRQIQRRAGSEKAPVPARELRDCLRRFKPKDWVVV